MPVRSFSVWPRATQSCGRRTCPQWGIHTGRTDSAGWCGAARSNVSAPADIAARLADMAANIRTLVLAVNAAPGAAVCFLSALQFHGIGTQLPHQVWLAVPRGTRVPTLAEPPLRIVRIASDLFELSLESHRIRGATVRVYSAARTIVDCFRFRSRVGLDVAARWRTGEEADHHGRTHEDRQAISRAAHHAAVSRRVGPLTFAETMAASSSPGGGSGGGGAPGSHSPGSPGHSASL